MRLFMPFLKHITFTHCQYIDNMHLQLLELILVAIAAEGQQHTMLHG